MLENFIDQILQQLKYRLLPKYRSKSYNTLVTYSTKRMFVVRTLQDTVIVTFRIVVTSLFQITVFFLKKLIGFDTENVRRSFGTISFEVDSISMRPVIWRSTVCSLIFTDLELTRVKFIKSKITDRRIWYKFSKIYLG